MDAPQTERLNELLGRLMRLTPAPGPTGGTPGGEREWNSLCDEIERVMAGLELVSLTPLESQLEALAGETAQALSKSVRWNSQGFGFQVTPEARDVLLDSLVHGIRNSLDHGIETAAARKKRGKLQSGNLSAILQNRGAALEVTLEDDGRGIDPVAIQGRALAMGLLTDEQAQSPLSPEDAAELLFKTGFSTKLEISQISGRGVGLDTIRARARELGGEAKLELKSPGCALKLLLPVLKLGVQAQRFELGGSAFWISENGFELVEGARPPGSQVLARARSFLEILRLPFPVNPVWVRLRPASPLSALGEILVPVDRVSREGFRVFRAVEATWAESGAPGLILSWMKAAPGGVLACQSRGTASQSSLEPLLDFPSYLAIIGLQVAGN